MEKKEHILTGIFGAFLFGLFYAALWVVFFIFWREDFSHWSAFLCTWLSCFGYAFLSANRKSKLAVLFGSIFGFLFSVVGHVVAYFVKFFISNYGTSTDILSFFPNARALIADYQNLLFTRGYHARFVQQLSIALVMAAIGVVLYCYTTFWSKKAKQEYREKEASILTEIWSDAPKKQEDIPASPDWIWNHPTQDHAAKKAPETLVKNDITSSLFGENDDSDDSDGGATGFTPKK